MKSSIIKILSTLFFIWHYQPLLSQPRDSSIAKPDSLKTYGINEVVVTATRSEIELKDSPSPIRLITSEDIQRINGSSAVDAIRSSESVFLKDYGPAAGLKTVSFRGMASEHIMVLIDGIRMNNFQNGQVDFSLIPINNIDRIEVVRGGNSALYGADAIGGIINIVTRKPSEAFEIHASASMGSFNYKKYAFEGAGYLSGIGLVFGIMHDYSDENYPFIFHRQGSTDTLQKRTGADFTRTQIYLNGSFSIDDHSLATLSVQRVKSNQGAPGSLSFVSNMRQDDDAIATIATIRDNHLGGFIFTMNAGFTYDLQTYYSKTRTTMNSLNPQVEFEASKWDRILLGLEYLQGNLDGMLPGAIIKRIQRSVYVSNEMMFQRRSNNFDRFSLFQTVRYDKLSEGEESFSPKFGLNIRIVKDYDLHFRASYGKNFRMPTFNDLYDLWLGNPALRPEKSECFDIGISTCLDRSAVNQFQITYFNINTRNRILPNSFYFPENVYLARSSGIESRYDLNLPSGMKLFVDLTMNDAIRQSDPRWPDSTNGKHLLFIPRMVSSVGFSFNLLGMDMNVIHTYTSKRYTSGDESQWLPEFSLVNFNANLTLKPHPLAMKLRFEVSNLFDKNYQVLPDYPMPGRSFRVSLGVDY